ncbi:MAG TPA: MFS transporter [Pseudolysinimonas sp.]|nr:MFS transporter [Pseudolysinimonas sp.]
MNTPARPFRWRAVIVVALLPTVLFSIGEGALIPVLPAVAGDLGATLAVAGLIGAALLFGQLLGDIPSGLVVARVGERPAMIGAAALAAAGTVLAWFAPGPVVLGIGVLVLGLATSVFALARHALLTTYVPLQYRARALSALGGTFRLGMLIGPFVGAATIQLTGSTESVFVVQIVGCVLAVVVLVALGDPEKAFRTNEPSPSTGSLEVAAETRGLFATLHDRRNVLLTLGLGSMLVAALRASRAVVLPLWAVSIGLGETATSLIIGVAGIVDFSLFFAGGWIMDRFGRLWTAVPSMLGLGIGHVVLAFTHDLPAAGVWFVVVAMFLSLSNGIGAGILMTLGADLADRRNPAPFLGAWRFTNDVGGALSPLLVAGLTALATISLAVGALGVLGLAGAVVLRVFIPKHLPRKG